MITSEVISYDLLAFEDLSGQIQIEQLPTILQVLEEIADDELSKKIDPLTSSHIAGLGCENNFYVTRDDDKQKLLLLPGSPSQGKYFRGQREFFSAC